jgi:hypothetical protein
MGANWHFVYFKKDAHEKSLDIQCEMWMLWCGNIRWVVGLCGVPGIIITEWLVSRKLQCLAALSACSH